MLLHALRIDQIVVAIAALQVALAIHVIQLVALDLTVLHRLIRALGTKLLFFFFTLEASLRRRIVIVQDLMLL